MAISPKALGSYMADKADDEMDDVELEAVEGEESEEHEAEESPEHEALEEFLEMLMEHGDAIESAAHAVELFTGEGELDEDTREQIEAALADMPEELKAGFKTYLAGLSIDELHELIEKLEESGAISNDAVVVPWLYHAARLVA